MLSIHRSHCPPIIQIIEEDITGLSLTKDGEKFHVLVVSNELKLRRVKIIKAVANSANIVHYQWLLDCQCAGKAIPCENYLVQEKTLNKAQARVQESQKLGGLLATFAVFVTQNDIKQSKKDFQEIVESLGGKFMNTARGLGGIESKKLIIISNSEVHNISSKKAKEAIKNGAIVVKVEEFFKHVIEHEPFTSSSSALNVAQTAAAKATVSF